MRGWASSWANTDAVPRRGDRCLHRPAVGSSEQAVGCREGCADIRVVEAARIPWRPLGRLLVSKGLLSDDQLENALREQVLTGRRLGEILVELGFVSHRALSLTLAEQYGVDLPSETGFGTGLLAAIDLRRDSKSDQNALRKVSDAVRALALVSDPTAPDAHEELSDQLPPTNHLPFANLEEQWAKLAAAEDRLAEAEREIADLARTSERRRGQVERLIERLRRREIHIAELSKALENELARTALTAPPKSHAPSLQSHLVLAQLAHGYELVERNGPPPEPNATLELPEICETKFVVAGVTRAPLPADPRRCVLALQIHQAHD
jgi:hypothetical protein